MFKSIVENSPLGILGVNAAGSITYCNSSAASIAFADRKRLIGSSISTIFPAIRVDGCRLFVSPNGSAPETNFIVVTSSEGEKKYYDVKVDHISDGERDETNVLTISDVTPRKRAWKAIEDQEKRWNLALQGSKIGVFESDLRTGLGSASDTWYQLLGLSKENGTNSDEEWRQRVHPEDLDAVLEVDSRCIDGQTECSEAKFRMISGDGTWRWMKSVLRVAERDDQGAATRVLGTMTDISSLECAVELAHSRRAELELLVSNTPIAMSVFEQDGSFAFYNGSFKKMFDYTKIPLENQTIGSLFGIRTAKELRRSIDAIVSGESESGTAETRITRPDGSIVDLQVSLSVLRNDEADRTQIIAQMLDVTEQKRLDKMKDDFVATVSHELRTPLASINGAIKLLAKDAYRGHSEQAKVLISLAERNCDRLLEVVDDLLNFQKLNRGELQLKMAPVNISQILLDVVKKHNKMANKVGVKYDLEVPPEPLVANADPQYLEQIFSHLVSNATKFSNKGGTVEIAAEKLEETIRVFLIDNGRGISEQFSEQIFEPFLQQADNLTRDKDGSGLGLAISKGLIEAMGGLIGYHSVPDVRTTFWIELNSSKANLSGTPNQLKNVSDLFRRTAALSSPT